MESLTKNPRVIYLSMFSAKKTRVKSKEQLNYAGGGHGNTHHYSPEAKNNNVASALKSLLTETHMFVSLELTSCFNNAHHIIEKTQSNVV